ncbi:hypothetical protein, partial [Neisseria polysaccharea]|uniref:hypothetical protein n=1 Tax=Neisseria polysaccharea TaxID=489 RepID=UPI0027E1889D
FIIFNIFKNLFIEPVENAVSLLYQGLQRFFLRFSCEKFATSARNLLLTARNLLLTARNLLHNPQAEMREVCYKYEKKNLLSLSVVR